MVKMFKVEKFVKQKNDDIECYDLGVMSESEMKSIVKNCEYDELLEMWFTKAAKIGYSVKEA